MDGTGMKVMMPAIKRRLDANGGDGVVVLVLIDGAKDSLDDVLADVETARNAANTALDRNGEELVWGAPASPSPKGPVVDIDWIGTDKEIEEWLNVFAATLAAARRSGSVTAAPQASFPQRLDSLFKADRMVASLAFTLRDATPYGYPPFTWLVDDVTTREVAEYATRWGTIAGATVYVSERTTRFVVDDPTPIDLFAAAIERSGMAGLTYLSQPPYQWRTIVTGPLGEAVYQAASIDETWASFIDRTREPLLRHGPNLDLAFIRLSRSSAPTFLDQGQLPAPPEIGDVGDFTRNRHLYDSFVPDAHAVQVLTAKHLAKANDLSAWTTRSLGNDRYLVEAHDLEPWFCDSADPNGDHLSQPDPTVVAAARRDFGAMILTQADLEADPVAWLPGRPPRPNTKGKPASRPRRS